MSNHNDNHRLLVEALTFERELRIQSRDEKLGQADRDKRLAVANYLRCLLEQAQDGVVEVSLLQGAAVEAEDLLFEDVDCWLFNSGETRWG